MAETRVTSQVAGDSRQRVDTVRLPGDGYQTTEQGADAADLAHLTIEERSRGPGRTSRAVMWFSAVTGAIVLLGGATLYLNQNRKPIVEVAVAQAVAGDEQTETILNASGYVTPRRRATVAAKITGRVTSVFAEEGMHVAEGQLLATLDDSDARVRLDSARADRETTRAAINDLEVRLANAERELKRAKTLAEWGIETAQALDQAQTTADSLGAQLELARTQVTAAAARIAVAEQDVENATIRSPFTGMVVSKDAQVGEMVSPISAGGGFTRTGIATIVDMQSLEIEVDVNESYIARVKNGQPAIATLDAYPQWQIPGHVRTVIPTADRQKATVKVRISFDRLDPRMLPDMGVKVAFLSAAPEKTEHAAKASIPAAAVRSGEGRQFVFVVRDGRVEQRAVSTTAPQGDIARVLAGLVPGETVVVRAPAALHEGQAVRAAP